MKCKLLFLVLLLFEVGHAQYHAFLSMGIEDGLAQSQVNAVAQGADGYLWVATASGLSRFDGTSVTNFYKSDGLVDNVITYILVTEDRGLFFGGLGGFTHYSNGVFTPVDFPKSLVDSRVQHMQMTSDDELWIATNRDGYFSYDLVQHSFSVPIISHGENIRWLDIARGFVAGRDGFYVHDDAIPDLQGVNVSDVELEGSRIWVSSLGEGLWVYEDQWKMISPDTLMSSAYLRDILITSDGEFWGAGPDGALSYRAGEWVEYGDENGLEYENLRAVAEDREGNIWLASNGQGLFRFSGGLFETYVKGNPLKSDIMLSMVEGPDGLLMGMFDEGLQLLDSHGNAENVGDILPTDVWALLRDGLGRVWVGTSSGLYRSLDGVRYERVFDEQLPSQRITALMEDAHGNVCVGHREGMTVIFSDSELLHYTEESGFDGKRIRAITQSVDGAWWLGAQNGLYRVEDDWVMSLDERNGLNDNTIYSIADDAYGRLWVGAKNGLHILMQDSVIQIMLSGRVDANNINFIHVSPAGQLYVGTNQGLFSSVVLENVDAMKFYRFGIEDGLPGLECNLNAIYQQESGRIWFGTNRGVVSFDESEFIDRPAMVEPSLRITGIRLFAEEFDMAERSDGMDPATGLPVGLIFRPGEDHITVDFKGIRMTDPQEISYQYMMEGIDRAWNNAGNNTSITYSSMGFGRFVFKVRCVDSYGQPLNEEARLAFRILPPLYLRWWAILLECTILLGMVYLIYRWRRVVRNRNNSLIELGYRTRMQSLEQQSLNSSMNRHFIFNSLNAIQYYINREDKRAANRYLSSFARLIRKNLDSTSTTWVSLRDEIERLELYLGLESMRFKDQFDYALSLDKQIDAEAVRVPSMLLQPFVENSIWHGLLPKQSKGHVLVEISRVEDRMRIRIEDDGIGIDTSRDAKQGNLPDHESKGMDITHHRLRLYSEMTGTDYEVQGPVQLEEKGRILGTRIDIFIPVSDKDV